MPRSFPRLRRWLGLIAGALLASYLGGLVAGVWLNTHPPRLPISAIPRTFNTPAEDLALTSADGVPLAGWYLPGLAEGVPGIVVCHGLGVNRSDVLPLAIGLQRAGFAVVLIDFRGHGESGDAAVSFGFREARDVAAAVDELARRAPGRPVGLYGPSMGGAAALLAAADDTRVAAVAAEAVYPDLQTSILHHLDLLFGGWSWGARPLLWTWQARFWQDPAAVAPRVAVAERPFPLLLIAGGADRRMTVAQVREVYQAATGPKELWVVDGADHGQAFPAAPDEYLRRVVSFFNRQLLGPEAS